MRRIVDKLTKNEFHRQYFSHSIQIKVIMDKVVFRAYVKNACFLLLYSMSEKFIIRDILMYTVVVIEMCQRVQPYFPELIAKLQQLENIELEALFHKLQNLKVVDFEEKSIDKDLTPIYKIAYLILMKGIHKKLFAKLNEPLDKNLNVTVDIKNHKIRVTG